MIVTAWELDGPPHPVRGGYRRVMLMPDRTAIVMFSMGPPLRYRSLACAGKALHRQGVVTIGGSHRLNLDAIWQRLARFSN